MQLASGWHQTVTLPDLSWTTGRFDPCHSLQQMSLGLPNRRRSCFTTFRLHTLQSPIRTSSWHQELIIILQWASARPTDRVYLAIPAWTHKHNAHLNSVHIHHSTYSPTAAHKPNNQKRYKLRLHGRILGPWSVNNTRMELDVLERQAHWIIQGIMWSKECNKVGRTPK